MAERWKATLRAGNPWWEGGGVPLAAERGWRRAVYGRLREFLLEGPRRRALLLVGPRRVGKTTLLQQLLSEIAPDRRSLYASLDYPDLQEVPLGRLLEEFLDEVAPKGEPVYAFLDEVPYAEGWARWLKQFAESQPRLRILATGSAAAALRRGGRESGAGRWNEIPLGPLSIREIAQIRGEPLPPSSADPLALPSSPALVPSRALLEEALVRGGFPQMWFERAAPFAPHEVLREDVVEKALFRDLQIHFGIRRPASLERLFALLSRETGRVLSLERIAKELRLSITAVDHYLRALRETHLVRLLRCFPGTSRRGIRGQAKFLLADTGLRFAFGPERSLADLDEGSRGSLLETLVGNHLAPALERRGGLLTYWREGDREVDFVAEDARGATPIEVKWGAVAEGERRGLRAFAERHARRARPPRELSASGDLLATLAAIETA
ncbi:MAG: ATP-binding protein [Planctomycetes bacterium]|nr:ATP-binding protein [Planctomycetota bacterium]